MLSSSIAVSLKLWNTSHDFLLRSAQTIGAEKSRRRKAASIDSIIKHRQGCFIGARPIKWPRFPSVCYVMHYEVSACGVKAQTGYEQTPLSFISNKQPQLTCKIIPLPYDWFEKLQLKEARAQFCSSITHDLFHGMEVWKCAGLGFYSMSDYSRTLL